MLRFGTISEIEPNKGLARVRFAEDGLVSAWLPVMQAKTSKDKFYHIPDVNEHVACLMDEHAENGVVLGAVYSKNESPGDVKGADKIGVSFESGDMIEYDRSTRKFLVKTNTTELSIAGEGPSMTKGGESLKTILSDLMDAILAETHPTAVGPTGPPLNAAQYTSIKTRITQFFEN
jgi:phage baseplate assembly protein V